MIFQNGHNVEQRDTTTNNKEQNGTSGLKIKLIHNHLIFICILFFYTLANHS
nr:MAG TPA: hypothetical protein [Caudoviricetes sp.]